MAHQLDRIEEMLTRLTSGMPEADVLTREQVRRWVSELFGAMATEHKIEAIKHYRALTGQGLKESKDAIERITNRMRHEAA